MASKADSRNKSVEIDVKTVDDAKPKTTASMKSPTGDRVKSSPKKDSSDMEHRLNNQELIVQLHDAVRDGDLKLVEYIISKRIDVNQRGQFGDNALHWAVLGGTQSHDRIVKKLVDAQADVNSVVAFPVFKPEVDPDMESRKREQAQDKKPRTWKTDHTALHVAASRGSEQCMKYLLNAKNVEFNALTAQRETPLHKAAMAGREANVKKLLEMGADINLVDVFENTALHHGAYSGDHNVVKRLMEAGASRNAVNKNKETPVDRAKTPGIAQLIFELSPDREDFYQDGDDDD